MNSIIKLIPRFVRVGIFALAEEHINDINETDLDQLKQTILSRLAAILRL